MQEKKPTNAQLQRKIKSAIVFVPKDKNTQSIFFSDKGVRLTTTSEEAVIETGYHKHVFFYMTQSGISRPYIYTKRIIEIALECNCVTEDGYSFENLLKTLEEEDKAKFNIVTYFGWWLTNIFHPLYSIGDSNAETFFVYNDYIHTLATNSILLSEKIEDITNKDFVKKECDIMLDFVNEGQEMIVFPKKTDEEIVKENIEAAQEEAING